MSTTIILNRVSVAGLYAQLAIADKRHAAMFVLGPPGVGKTTIMRAHARRARPDKEFWYINGAGMPPEQVAGVMFFDDVHIQNRSCFLALNEMWLKVQEGDTVCIDEFDKMPLQTQNVCLELIQFGSINGRKIGNGKIHVYVCANTAAVKNGTFGVSSLGTNRSRYVEFVPDHHEAIAYLVQAGVHPLVSAFLNAEGNARFVNPGFNPSSLLNATSRTWHEVGLDLNVLPDNASESLIVQTMATRLPAEIVTLVQQHIHYYDKRIEWSKVEKDPDNCKIPGADEGNRGLMSMQLWYCASVVSQMKPENPDKKSLKAWADARHALWRYAKRFPPEFLASVMPVIVGAHDGESVSMPQFLAKDTDGIMEFTTWMKRRQEALKGL
jgi:hypothetical protein